MATAVRGGSLFVRIICQGKVKHNILISILRYYITKVDTAGLIICTLYVEIRSQVPSKQRVNVANISFVANTLIKYIINQSISF